MEVTLIQQLYYLCISNACYPIRPLKSLKASQAPITIAEIKPTT